MHPDQSYFDQPVRQFIYIIIAARKMFCQYASDLLYGGDQATIERTLRDGRNGRMPAFGQTLNADKVRLVAAYVYSLSQ